jgi:hypothetical protein
MAKWGDSYRWHGGTLWGGTGVVSDPYSGDVVWIVNIDWTGTGATNEADYVRNIDSSRGRQHYVNPAGTGFEKIQPGKVTLLMDNSSGRFNPYNTSSPIYNYVLPGRKIQILVYIVATKKTEVRFSGHITDIQPSSGINEVTITAEDGMRWLADADYSSGVTYAKTTSEAIDLVLSFVNWPYQRNIQDSVQPLQVFEPGNGNALNIIQELAEANLGVFFVDKNGSAVFYPVSYNVTNSHSVDQASLLREIRVPQPWETVRNKIRVVANRKGKRPVSAVWTMAGIETFTSGQAKTFGTTFASADGITVETLTANTQSDGNGTNVSGNFTVGKSSVTATECTLTVTNNSGGTAYLLALRLVGSEIVSAPEQMTSNDTTSISSYGPRSFVLDNTWLQDRGYALAYATMLKTHLKDPHKDPIIQIQQRPEEQFDFDLYDKVVLTSTFLGISATFTIGGIEEKWMSDTGQNVVTTLYLQTILYDATSITPDPFVPGALPDIGFDDFPYWFDPYTPSEPYEPGGGGDTPPDPTNYCLTVGAEANGPYMIKPMNQIVELTTTPPNITLDLNYPCTIRPGNAENFSMLYISMQAFTKEGDGGDWVAVADSTPYVKVDAVDSNGSTVVVGTVQSAIFPDILGIYSYMLPGSATEVAGFKISLSDSAVIGVPTSDATSSSDGVDFTFNFNSGAQGWVASSTSITNPVIPATAAEAWWANGRLNVQSDGFFETINWRWVPIQTMQAGSSDSYIQSVTHSSVNNFMAIGIITTAGGWEHTNVVDITPITTHYIEHPLSNISLIGFDNSIDVSAGIDYLESMTIHGFTAAPVHKMLQIYTVEVRNVCATGIL